MVDKKTNNFGFESSFVQDKTETTAGLSSPSRMPLTSELAAERRDMLRKQVNLRHFKMEDIGSDVEVLEIQRLRDCVWRAVGVVPKCAKDGSIFDHHDSHAEHWGVYDGTALAAAARMCVHLELLAAPDGHRFTSLELRMPVASLNRLVVRDEYRGRGIASMLDDERIRAARKAGAKTIIATCSHDYRRVEALTRRGFVILPDDVVDAGWSPNWLFRACYLRL